MSVGWIIAIICLSLIAIMFLLLLIIFLIVFYVPPRTKRWLNGYHTPPGKIYNEYREEMVNCIKEIRKMPHETYSIKTFDGLTLCGRYFEQEKGAPIELMFHGYRGNADGDLGMGIKRSFKMGHNAFVVDNRASGHSQGNVITFGAKESKDCLEWIKFLIKTFGEDVKIILTGISMGASTVLIAAGNKLPENVVGVIADCGYTSAEDIIKKVVKKIGLPERFFYSIIKFSAKLFAGVNLNEADAFSSLKNCEIPIVFFHGGTDQFVPCYMSEQNYNHAATTKKRILIVEGAGHGLSYIVNPTEYEFVLTEFKKDCGLI